MMSDKQHQHQTWQAEQVILQGNVFTPNRRGFICEKKKNTVQAIVIVMVTAQADQAYGCNNKSMAINTESSNHFWACVWVFFLLLLSFFHIPSRSQQRNYCRQRNYSQENAQNYPQLKMGPGATEIIIMTNAVYMYPCVNIRKPFDWVFCHNAVE